MTDYNGLIIKPFIVSVHHHGECTYYTRSRGKALAEAWSGNPYGWSFKEFLERANAYSGLGHPRFGERIEVAGEAAFIVSVNSQYIRFVYPDSDVIHNSHPLDVEPPEARRGTPYYSEPLAQSATLGQTP